jgi:hypothetical protein
MKVLLFLLLCISAFSADLNESLTSDYNATLTADRLGMSYSDYNFSMALAGSLIGFVFLSSIVYLASSIGRGR